MPELPEVETVRRGLAPVLEGATIRRLQLRRPDLRYPFPADFAARVAGRRVRSLSRRGKYLLMELESGPCVVMHLGMSGSFRIEMSGMGGEKLGRMYHETDRLERHDHVFFDICRDGSESRVIYNDPRRFGFMALLSSNEPDETSPVGRLGLDPLGNAMSADALAQCFDGMTAPLKSALLDQRRIAGLGNIYACEALWQAGLSPLRPAGTICGPADRPAREAAALAEAIREVLQRAIAAGGSTLRDHRLADGSLGYFQHSFAVYDRAGHACIRPHCNGTIERMRQAGRSTFWCPACQS